MLLPARMGKVSSLTGRLLLGAATIALLLGGCRSTPAAGQTWEITDELGNTAILNVDAEGRFTGTGWRGGGSGGIPEYGVSIRDGLMAGTAITFSTSATYNNGQGRVSGRGEGTLNAAFPQATSATGKHTGTITDPFGTRSYSLQWTARRISGGPPATTGDQFDFDVDISPTFKTITQGEAIGITVTVRLVRGTPRPVTLTTTGWQPQALQAGFVNDTITPGGSTVLRIFAACKTPPGNYTFTVRGEAAGTFRTSQDAVTITVTANPNCARDEAARQHNNRAVELLQQGDYHGAIAELNEAIAVRPDYALAYNNLGYAYYKLAQDEAALASFTRAIELDPTLAPAYRNRGLVYDRQEDWQSAIADYSRAVELDPQMTLAYNSRGLDYHRLGDYDGAIADFSRAIQLEPERPEPHYNRGLAYLMQEQYHPAIADFSRAIQLRPDYARAFADRGLAYYHLRNYEAALADYDEAIRLDPGYDRPFFNRALLYEATGQVEAAIADYEQFLALAEDPDLRQQAEAALRRLREQ